MVNKIFMKSIDNCSECPHWVMAGSPFFCGLAEKDITENDLEPFPKWCPLPDAPTEPGEGMICPRCKQPMTQVFKCFRCPPIETPGLK